MKNSCMWIWERWHIQITLTNKVLKQSSILQKRSVNFACQVTATCKDLNSITKWLKMIFILIFNKNKPSKNTHKFSWNVFVHMICTCLWRYCGIHELSFKSDLNLDSLALFFPPTNSREKAGYCTLQATWYNTFVGSFLTDCLVGIIWEIIISWMAWKPSKGLNSLTEEKSCV